MPALVPQGTLSLLAFLLIFAGTVAIVVSRRVPKAYGLGILMIVVFAFQMLGDHLVTLQLGFMPALFLSGQQWWAPFTYMYVHAPGTWFHIFGNLFILLTAGPALEDRIGGGRFLLVYFAAGFAAAAAHIGLALLDTAIVSPFSLAVGASGAIFGVLTVFAVRYPRETLPIPLILIVYLPSFVVLLLHLGMNLAFMLRPGSGIAWWGHFAGYLVGLGFAYTLTEPPAVKGAPRELPDVDALRPLATSQELKQTLDRLEQFKDAEFKEDAAFADAWVDRFLDKARCPECGGPLARDGFTARCPKGHYEVDFRRAKGKRAQ